MRSYLFLICIFCFTTDSYSQSIPYGNNSEAGNYFSSDGVKLYYEIYGQGEPILLLHGGVYGYIDEFGKLISVLSKTRQVICLATRGHGKSEIGHEPFTYNQRADDAFNLIRHLKLPSVVVLGFSDGGYTALYLAAFHPDAVKKIVAMGVGLIEKGSRAGHYHYSAEVLMSQNKSYFENRLKGMPEPDRWDESLQMINKLYNEAYLDDEILSEIKCPVLLMSGEKDPNHSIDDLINCYYGIGQAELSIIPHCGHVILECNFPAVWESMKGFIQ